MKFLSKLRWLLNEMWTIPCLLLVFFIFVETSHMAEHSHCRNTTEQSKPSEDEE
jgi:hypothetical protein